MTLDHAIQYDIRARSRLPEQPAPSMTDYLHRLAARLDSWRLHDLTQHAEALVQDQERAA